MRVVAFLALRQLWERRVLSLIAILAVTLGVTTLIAMRGIQLGYRNKFLQTITRVTPQVAITDKELTTEPPLLARHLGDFVAAHVAHEAKDDRQSRIKRPTEILHAARSLEGVRAAAPSVSGSALLTYAGQELPCELRGIEPLAQDDVTAIRDYIVDGTWTEFAQSRDGVLLGTGAAQKLGVKVGDTVVLVGPRSVRALGKVMGTFSFAVQSIDDSRVMVPLKMGQTVLSRPDIVSRIEVRIDDAETANIYAERMQRLFGIEVESWQKANASFLGVFAVQDIVTAFIIASILVVGGFGILAVQIMMVLQKTRDVALLRATGFRRGDILGLFLLQGAIVALIGAAIGSFFGHELLTAVSHITLKTNTAYGTADTMLVDDDPRMYLYGALFALVIGLLASAIPAVRGSRIEPVDVLRGMVT
ncbi:ABC transporter permease [Pendulispora brunnea]|uniref:ABC transporter permease n=1 Tax=Pendulispora brunnea TaxID=2905690 RepID=A0ABZ2K4J6_9BACT